MAVMARTPTAAEGLHRLPLLVTYHTAPLVRTVMVDMAATRAMFRAIRKNAFLAEVQKFVEKIAVCEREGGREGGGEGGG